MTCFKAVLHVAYASTILLTSAKSYVVLAAPNS